ncbi:MAG TPA: hypothetical protein VK752_23470 [Bryobacteraceae bacterium]|jgi:hypothetical protein|nr:hypothetical protein [Bryobacteraceae bacterium]
MASDAVTDLPVSFTWQQWPGPPAVTMIAKLDISHLHFQPWQDRRTQKLTIVAVVLDNQGSFVAGKQSELELSFRDATFSQLAKTGFTVAMSINAPPGRHSVRAVAQDAMENKVGRDQRHRRNQISAALSEAMPRPFYRRMIIRASTAPEPPLYCPARKL